MVMQSDVADMLVRLALCWQTEGGKWFLLTGKVASEGRIWLGSSF